MISVTSGFITTRSDTTYYRVGKKLPEEAGLDTCFFVGLAVKSIGESYRDLQLSQSAESAAARGSCGIHEVTA